MPSVFSDAYPQYAFLTSYVGVVVGTPAQDYDDSYCIEYAKRHSAYILTNDRYRDHIETLSSNEEKRQVRQWLKTHLITFSFVFDDLLPNPDFRFLSE